jgi:excisionase family DNA binding protein
MPTPKQEAVSTKTACKMLGLSDESVKRYIMAGTLRGFRLPSGHFRVELSSIEELIEKGDARVR